MTLVRGSPARRSTPPVSTMVGAVLGNYRITSELSSGGMGTVYRGEHALLERAVAIKFLRAELTHDESLVQRFFNEARAATAIRHPGIIEIYDFGYTAEGYAYLVMEFLEGSQLGKRIAARKRCSELEAAQIARGIASALKAAHAKDIVHRDLKPDNIFLVPDSDGPTGERVKVLDFGIAKLNDPNVARQTQTGSLIGTPLYMAPEQARAAGTIDARADLYSLGCILYELLVGRPPFVAEGIGEIIALQMFETPRPPQELVPDISPEMNALVLQLLEKEPADRPQTAQAVIDALTALGARLSGRLSTPAMSAAHSAVMATPARSSTQHLVAKPLVRTLHDPKPEERRSALPIVAGAITLALAIVVVTIVMTRGGEAPAAAPPPPPGSASNANATMSAPPALDAGVAPDAAVIADDEPLPPPPHKLKKFPTTPPAPRPQNPVTIPAGSAAGSAKGPTTQNGSPIELELDDPKDKTP